MIFCLPQRVTCYLPKNRGGQSLKEKKNRPRHIRLGSLFLRPKGDGL